MRNISKDSFKCVNIKNIRVSCRLQKFVEYFFILEGGGEQIHEDNEMRNQILDWTQ